MDTESDILDLLFRGYKFNHEKHSSTLPPTRYNVVASDGTIFAEHATLSQCRALVRALDFGGTPAGWKFVDVTSDYVQSPTPVAHFPEQCGPRDDGGEHMVYAPHYLPPKVKLYRGTFHSAAEARILANPVATINGKPFIGYCVLDGATLAVLAQGSKEQLAPWIRTNVGVRSLHKIRVVPSPNLRQYRDKANIIVAYYPPNKKRREVYVRGTVDECKTFLRTELRRHNLTESELKELRVVVA